MDQVQMWALNIGLLIGILMALGILIILGFVGWTGLRVWLFARSQKSANSADTRGTQGQSDDLLFRERGMCVGYGRMMDRTVQLQNGQRVCTHCFAKAQKRHASQPPSR
jgi:hypothetical protein